MCSRQSIVGDSNTHAIIGRIRGKRDPASVRQGFETVAKRIVDEDIYQRTRNPMSLGYYLLAMAIGLLVGSTAITLAVLLGVIPAHVFFLKYFEEFELGLRFGDAYEAYKRRTPFLIPRFR